MPPDPVTPVRGRIQASELLTPSTTYTSTYTSSWPPKHIRSSSTADFSPTGANDSAESLVLPITLFDSLGRSNDRRATAALSKKAWARESLRISRIPEVLKRLGEAEAPAVAVSDGELERIERVRQRIQAKYVDNDAAVSQWRWGLQCLSIHHPLAKADAFVPVTEQGESMTDGAAAAGRLKPDDELIWDIVRERGELPEDEDTARAWIEEHKAARSGGRTALGRKIKAKDTTDGGGKGKKRARSPAREAEMASRPEEQVAAEIKVKTESEEVLQVGLATNGRKRKVTAPAPVNHAANGAPLSADHPSEASLQEHLPATTSGRSGHPAAGDVLRVTAARLSAGPTVTLLQATASGRVKPASTAKSIRKKQSGIMEAGAAVGWVSDKASSSTAASQEKDKGKGTDNSGVPLQRKAGNVDRDGDDGKEVKRIEQGIPKSAGLLSGLPALQVAIDANYPAVPVGSHHKGNLQGAAVLRSNGTFDGNPVANVDMLAGEGKAAALVTSMDVANQNVQMQLPATKAQGDQRAEEVHDIDPIELSELSLPPPPFNSNEIPSSTPKSQQRVSDPGLASGGDAKPLAYPTGAQAALATLAAGLKTSRPPPAQTNTILAGPIYESDVIPRDSPTPPLPPNAADDTAPSERARVRRLVLDSDSDSDVANEAQPLARASIAAGRLLASQASTAGAIPSSFADRSEERVLERTGQAERDLLGALDRDIDELD